MTSPLVITLPVPDSRISPNASTGPGRSKGAILGKSRITKRHRNLAADLTRELLGTQYHKLGLPIPTFAGYSIAHYFKTAAFRDDDNADGACKAYRDGIADALGIDDRHLPKLRLSTRAKDAGNPRVEITLHLTPHPAP